MLSSASLPPELWQEVIYQLPGSSRRTCLAVSRAFHALAIRLVFADVTISFGAWETWDGEDNISDADKLEDERSARSFDLLYHISVNPQFASVVRNVEIHAFKLDGVRGAFEIRKCAVPVLSSEAHLRRLPGRCHLPPARANIVRVARQFTNAKRGDYTRARAIMQSTPPFIRSVSEL